MASLKQLEANRRNALKSTGPRTPEGKKISCLNALKHGVYSHNVVLPLRGPSGLGNPFQQLRRRRQTRLTPSRPP